MDRRGLAVAGNVKGDSPAPRIAASPRQSEDRAARREAAPRCSGEMAHHPRAVSFKAVADRGGVACPDGITRVAQGPEPRLTIYIQDAIRGLPDVPRMARAFEGHLRGVRSAAGGAAGIVTRMCRDAAGGSVARPLLTAR